MSLTDQPINGPTDIADYSVYATKNRGMWNEESKRKKPVVVSAVVREITITLV